MSQLIYLKIYYFILTRVSTWKLWSRNVLQSLDRSLNCRQFIKADIPWLANNLSRDAISILNDSHRKKNVELNCLEIISLDLLYFSEFFRPIYISKGNHTKYGYFGNFLWVTYFYLIFILKNTMYFGVIRDSNFNQINKWKIWQILVY